jgi:indolepyruvate ferredoxin oxidoreductase alpha subunit
MMPTLEPSNQQEAYDMMALAFDLSEKVNLPVLVRVTTRMAHSRSAVLIKEKAREENALNYDAKASNWVLLPVNARKRNDVVTGQQPELEQMAASSKYNDYCDGKDHSLGIIACGIGYNYVMENFPKGSPYPILKISQYPLPKEMVRKMTLECRSVLIVEEGQPFVEEQVRGVMPGNAYIKGRLSGELPRTGELTPDLVATALGFKVHENYAPCEDVVPRPPAFCQGCGHRDVYTALNEVLKDYPDARVFGDIGCYTLGFLPPFKAIHSCVDMGASIGMAKGAADAGQWPSVAVIGDSTFTHSGMTGLLDAINENSNITVIISDNLTTAMTGGQDSAGTNKFEAICRGLGLDNEHLKVVVPIPKNMPEITRILREEIEYKGVSVIIPRRECMQTLQRHIKQQRLAKEAKKMKTDVILCGVGGQGILTIATIIGEAAMQENLYIKQSEVHGMSQRGGDVQSNLRISNMPIMSDLIAEGSADVIISMEPMEALRYLPYLSKDGWVITASKPFVNIPNYPDMAKVESDLNALEHVIVLDIEQLAKDNGIARSANVILLGAAQKALGIELEKLEAATRSVFARKGEAVVEANLKALAIGKAAQR